MLSQPPVPGCGYVPVIGKFCILMRTAPVVLLKTHLEVTRLMLDEFVEPQLQTGCIGAARKQGWFSKASDDLICRSLLFGAAMAKRNSECTGLFVSGNRGYA